MGFVSDCTGIVQLVTRVGSVLTDISYPSEMGTLSSTYDLIDHLIFIEVTFECLLYKCLADLH